jgi:all-trans-8'-apo-beta-carotenal 15,15'-oxygenase
MAAATALPVAASRDQTRRLLTEDLERQHGFEPLDIEGAIPVELRGTLYRNGPGQFGQFGTRYTHPFEGDGAITAVRFEAGSASGACRVTETAGLREERAAARLLYGFSAPWLRRVRNMLAHRHKNVANTSVMLWQGRLFALMEAGLPTEIDPQELGCLGESTLDRTIVSWFSAHPHRVAARRAVYNFGLEMGRVTRLHLYELPDVGAARHLGAVELPGPPMLHDFIATETHLVFFVSPVRIDVPRMLLQLGDFRQMFRYRPELGTEVLCVPIDRPDEVVRFTVDAFYQWHFTNAFTRGGQLIVDYIHYRTFDSFYELGGAGDGKLDAGHPHRAVIDLQRRRLHTEPTSERKAEFPTIASDRAGSEHTRSRARSASPSPCSSRALAPRARTTVGSSRSATMARAAARSSRSTTRPGYPTARSRVRGSITTSRSRSTGRSQAFADRLGEALWSPPPLAREKVDESRDRVLLLRRRRWLFEEVEEALERDRQPLSGLVVARTAGVGAAGSCRGSHAIQRDLDGQRQHHGACDRDAGARNECRGGTASSRRAHRPRVDADPHEDRVGAACKLDDMRLDLEIARQPIGAITERAA